MQLYGSLTSPYVRHARIALMESGLEWEFIETSADSAVGQSPLLRVPFLIDAERRLTDSMVIIRHARERAGQDFLGSIDMHEQFCLANSVLDAATGLFFAWITDARKPDPDGAISLSPRSGNMLNRQQARVEAGLDALNQLAQSYLVRSRAADSRTPYDDAELRLACTLAWGLFRKRFTLQDRPALAAFLAEVEGYPLFAETAPPG